jgi:hypothetical protein
MPQLVAVIWWPHSGGRWLCRSILKNHSKIYQTVFTHPWLYFSTDMMMDIDNTAQVHKARSLPELKPHLDALVESIDYGKEKSISKYFEMISKYEIGENTHILGEICMGSPIPRVIDVEVMMKTFPSMKIIHLVRNPIDSFNSFAKRYEMDSDPVKIGGSWLTLNYSLRSYFENNSEHKGNYMCVKYEDLLDKPKEKIKEVCGFLNLDFEESLTSNLDQRWGRNTQNNISEGTRKIIEEIAKPELTKYNY